MAAMMQPEKEKPGLLARYTPIVHWLPHYNNAWLSGDIIAGLSVWALMVPQCLGFAAICGVPVQYGLYAAAIALIVYDLFLPTPDKLQRMRPKKSAGWMIMSLKKPMIRHLTSLIASCSMKARRWISFWNISPKKLVNISITMAGNYSSKF
jgi:hypothetical protein